jgi:hypothetical protein
MGREGEEKLGEGAWRWEKVILGEEKRQSDLSWCSVTAAIYSSKLEERKQQL